MEELKQTVIINKPLGKVFAFTINPANTPKWVEPIVYEQTSEWPVKPIRRLPCACPAVARYAIRLLHPI
jgi:hypothetical protein